VRDENKARTHALKVIENEIKMSILVSQFEGWGFSDFLDDIQSIVSKYREDNSILI
jgi:hypothetical protein